MRMRCGFIGCWPLPTTLRELLREAVTSVLVIADIVVVEIAHPLARHLAKSSLLQRYCVRRAR
jgi:hypothetical protein